MKNKSAKSNLTFSLCGSEKKISTLLNIMDSLREARHRRKLQLHSEDPDTPRKFPAGAAVAKRKGA